LLSYNYKHCQKAHTFSQVLLKLTCADISVLTGRSNIQCRKLGWKDFLIKIFLSACCCCLLKIFFKLQASKVSISSTFYTRLLLWYFCAKKLQSQNEKSFVRHFCTKNAHVKCWWKDPLVRFFVICRCLSVNRKH